MISTALKSCDFNCLKGLQSLPMNGQIGHTSVGLE